jgi:hypothetical protein
VEQQVSLSLYDQRPKQTHKRLSTSHQAGVPKGYDFSAGENRQPQPALRSIGTPYGVSKDSLSRHFHAHLRDAGDDDQDGESRQISDLSEQKKSRTARDSQCRLRNLRTEALGAPLSDQQCLRDERVLFLSDIFPTGLIERG